MESTVPGTVIEQVPQAILLDGTFQSFLLGTILCQANYYRKEYKDDSRGKKLFIALVVFLAILQAMLENYKVWRITIAFERWSTSPIQWTDFFLNGCVCVLCQGFFIRRCWKLRRKSRWILYPMCLFLATIFAANLALAITMCLVARRPSYVEDSIAEARNMLPETIVPFSYWIIASACLDIWVASTLTWTLWKLRLETVEDQRDGIFRFILTLTWGAALPPVVSMVAAFALFHLASSTKSHYIVMLVVLTGKLYTVAVLWTLNSRQNLRGRMMSEELGRTSLSNWQWDQEATLTSRVTEGKPALEGQPETGAPMHFDNSLGIPGHVKSRHSTVPGPGPDLMTVSRARGYRNEDEASRAYNFSSYNKHT